MSEGNKKIRALFLTALMVFSVVGGTVALAGTAVAANDAQAGAGNSGTIQGAAIEPANVTEGTTTNNHIVRFTVTNVSGDGNSDTVNVTFNETLASQGLSVNSVDAKFTNDTDVAISSSAVVVDGDTVQFGIQPSASGDIEFKVDVTTTAPEVDSDTDYGINASFVDSGGDNVDSTEIATLTVVDTDATNNGFLSGRVSDQNNNDIQNATVIATRNSDDLQASTLTNENGEYTLELPEGDYDIRVVREGFNTATSKDNNVTANQTTSANLVITRQVSADDITIVESDKIAVADGEDTVSYTVNVTTNDTANGEPAPMSGVSVEVNAPGDVNFTASSVTTGDDGTATFTATSNVTGEYDLNFTEQDNSNTVDTTATFRPEEGDALLTGHVANNETDLIEGATVWVAYEGENQTLAYAQENQEWLVDQTTSDGLYTIEGIVAESGTADVNVYVSASGYNKINATDSVGSYIAANDTQQVTSGDSENHDFVVFPGGPAQEYALDLTVEGEKSIEAAEGNEITATVTVEQRQKGSSLSWNAAANQEIQVETTSSLPLEPDVVSVTTDENGEAQITFTTENTGDTNITATTTNSDGDVYNTSAGEQAEVSVYGTGQITGDVVNEDDEALAAGQATVELFVNESGEWVSTGETSEIGASGAYVFTDVRSGEQYRMVATTETGLTGKATTAGDIPSGTTTNDIVVVGATPSPAEFQVSDLSPQNVTVTQGDTINVSANVSNVGVVDDTQTVEFRVGGNVVASQEVSLNGSETKAVTFENIDTSSLDAGTYTHGVYTNDDDQTATLTIESNSDNGGTTLTDVLSTIEAYENGDATLTDVLNIISEYES